MKSMRRRCSLETEAVDVRQYKSILTTWFLVWTIFTIGLQQNHGIASLKYEGNLFVKKSCSRSIRDFPFGRCVPWFIMHACMLQGRRISDAKSAPMVHRRFRFGRRLGSLPELCMLLDGEICCGVNACPCEIEHLRVCEEYWSEHWTEKKGVCLNVRSTVSGLRKFRGNWDLQPWSAWMVELK